MAVLDVITFVFYVAGIVAMGGLVTKIISNSLDLFAAGRSATWWINGFSGFMTMFSAGTFVVWGGIAYKFGLVAVNRRKNVSEKGCRRFGDRVREKDSALVFGFLY